MTTLNLTIGDLYTTFYRQLRQIEAGNVTKIMIEDDSSWRTLAGRQGILPIDNNYVAVLVPASQYLPLTGQMENQTVKHLVYSEIAARSDQYDVNGLYKLTSSVRDLSTFTFDTTAAEYTFDSPAPNSDITVTAKVPGEAGNNIFAQVIDGVPVPVVTAVNTSFTLSLTNGLTTATSAVNAFANTDASNLVVPLAEGDGSGVVNMAETTSGSFSIGLHAGGTAGSTVGGFFAHTACAALTGVNGINVGYMFAGKDFNGITVNVINQLGTNPLSVSWASNVLTIKPETVSDIIVGTVSSVVAYAGWEDAVNLPFTCTAYGSLPTAIMDVSSSVLDGGKSRSEKAFTWKSLYLHKTKNIAPSYVIVGYKQAVKLQLI